MRTYSLPINNILRLVLASGLLYYSAVCVMAQAQGNNGADSGSNSSASKAGQGESTKASAEETTNFRQNLDQAKTLAKSRDIAAAEKALTKDNTAQADTPEWHMETTHKLMQAAGDLAREGNNAAVVASLATQSLQHLNQVCAAATDSKAKANAKVSMAYIQERFQGDPVAAMASYQAALALAPNDKGAAEALERLQKADANLRAKIRSTKK